MQDIQPDTSLYCHLPDKLRAFAAILESDQEFQVRHHAIKNGEWTDTGPFSIKAAAQCMIDGTHQYRKKPKPRELWVLYGANGEYCNIYPDKFVPAPGHTVVRFVEQP